MLIRESPFFQGKRQMTAPQASSSRGDGGASGNRGQPADRVAADMLASCAPFAICFQSADFQTIAQYYRLSHVVITT
ncbi:hypothetical protein Bra5_CH02009 [Rhizobium phaseoli Brasil 5]|nr:hypothetical protein Bra5_CH02009 [Rhizobium phaseoli Brasil 5]